MADRHAIDRRSFSGLKRRARHRRRAWFSGGLSGIAFGQTGKDLQATIFTSAGSLNLVFDALMKQQGYFKEFGVDATVQNVSDGSKIISALLGGNGDMCAGSGFSSLLPAIEKGAKLKILAGAALNPLTALYSSRKDIRSAKDLIGKTVGTGAPGALLHELVVGLMIKKGLDYTKVTFVNVGSGNDIFKAVMAGTVDAGHGEVGFYTQQEKYGVHALTDGALWDELPEYTIQASFASDEVIAKKRETIVRCLAAYAKMYRFVQSPNSFEAWRQARATALGSNDLVEAKTQWDFYQSGKRLAENLVVDPGQHGLRTKPQRAAWRPAEGHAV